MKSFTLTEFLIIASILAILIGIALPFFRNYQPDLQLNGTVRNLVSDFRYAQQLAITEQVEYGVRFLTTSDYKSYQIIEYKAATSVIKTVSFPEEISEVAIVGLSDIEGDKEARYIPYGSIKNSQSGTITLKNTKNATSTVEIKPSGFVKISD